MKLKNHTPITECEWARGSVNVQKAFAAAHHYKPQRYDLFSSKSYADHISQHFDVGIWLIVPRHNTLVLQTKILLFKMKRVLVTFVIKYIKS
jgi:hypothetical protein